ncbi:PfkB family carbohydrate kinase [Microbacterium sp. X-17]|uniref:PfkB family carbohydrate kinase n=1 Tax=Microbacterium sp. X-17 TaxID=3144404 RepID=UPI0031F5AEE5
MSAPAGRVVVVGDALIDELRDGANVRELIGGAALNVAVGLSRLGVPATLVAMVGDDTAGDHIRAYLRDYGVDLIATPSPRGTARAIVTRSERGEPSYLFTEAARERRIRFGRVARAAFADAALVVVSCFAFDDAEQTAELEEALAGTDAVLAVDPNPREGMLRDRAAFVSGFERITRGAALVKVGADDAQLLYGASLDDVRARLLRNGVDVVLATRGSAGAEVSVSGAGAEVRVSRPIASVPGRVVDTTGAGDAVLASVVATLRTDPPADAAAWAAALDRAMGIAAATCRFEGALLRLPSALDDIDLDALGT